jgi:tRNA (cytidine/uridine-2'-O-)-methyltransferase
MRRAARHINVVTIVRFTTRSSLILCCFLPRANMLYDPVLHVVLHHPQIPPNTGNIGRTCVAAGAKLWLVKPLGFDVSEKARRRAGLDYWEHLEWEITDDWHDLSTKLAPPLAAGRAWYFSKKATRLYTDVAYQPGDVLVFGSETTGLPEEMLAEQGDRCVRIPARPQVRSLNLSAAAAVGVYEALRQFGTR